MKKSRRMLLAVFLVVTVLVTGTSIARITVYRVSEQGILIGLLVSNVSSKGSVESQELYDWDGILKPIRKNKTLNELISKISNGFREWVMEDKLRYLKLLFHPGGEISKMYFSQFLSENPEYRDYISQYVDMISEIHRSMVPILSQSYCDLIVKKGEVVKRWKYNLTIDGNEFTVACTLYELSINGTVQKLVKANFYNSEGVLISDPYAGVYLYYIPAYVWPWGWFIIGENLYFNVRFTYPDESNLWAVSALAGMVGGASYESILGWLFPTAAAKAGGGNVLGAIVGLYLLLGLNIIPELEAEYLKDRTYYAWGMSAHQNWGIQSQLHVYYIYSWTVYGWLPSYFMIGYVLYNGAYVQGLPNPYTPYVPIISVGGLLAYKVASAWQLNDLRSNMLLWGAALGLNRMVWMGTWPTE
ncbi:MAG: hypothetical protein ACTSP1_08375 [Candidatus Freyarchaeota archaeon]